MNIGIDIDDTITNTYEHKLAYATKYATENLHELNIEKPYARHLTDILNWSNEIELKFFKEYFVNEMINIPLKSLAKEVINKLYKEGHNIYFITARADDFIQASEQVTKKWLEKNKLNFTDIFFFDSGEKFKIAKKLNIDLFIDDSFKVCMDMDKQNIPSFLMTDYSNINEDLSNTNITRVHTWPEIYNHILNFSDKGN